MRLSDLLAKVPERSAVYPIEQWGEGDVTIAGVAHPVQAGWLDMTYCSVEYLEQYPGMSFHTGAACMIVPKGVKNLGKGWRIVLTTPQPKLLFARLAQPFMHRGDEGTVTVGANCYIDQRAVIRHADIGDNVIIGPGVVIGGDGFGFVLDEGTGEVIKFPQMGRVKIGDNVEIMANSCICRGSLTDTVIEDEVKIDQLVHVGHGARIGKGTLLIAHTQIGGSSDIGRYCWLAPSVTTIDHCNVGDFALLGMGAVATKDVPANTVNVGVPARPIRKRYEDGHPALEL